MSAHQFHPTNHLYPAQFRNAAAGLLKSLIRARATQQPRFLPTKDYQRWGVADVELETRSCAQLLTRVRQLRQQFEEEFLGNKGSVSEPELLEDTDDIEILAERVAAFICGDLEAAIHLAADDKSVPWQKLAKWSELGSLRDALDQLPLPLPTTAAGVRAVAQSSQVTLFGLKDKPIVNGQEKPPLSIVRYKLVEALINAGEQGLTKSSLERDQHGLLEDAQIAARE